MLYLNGLILGSIFNILLSYLAYKFILKNHYINCNIRRPKNDIYEFILRSFLFYILFYAIFVILVY